LNRLTSGSTYEQEEKVDATWQPQNIIAKKEKMSNFEANAHSIFKNVKKYAKIKSYIGGQMFKLLQILIIAVIILAGCSLDDTTSPNSNDPSLKDQLVGYWSFAPNFSITYNDDFTYCDSVFVMCEGDTTYTLARVTTGEYSLRDSILNRTMIHVTYIDTLIYSYLGQIVWDFEQIISFDNGELSSTTVKTFDLVEGSGNELWGTWTRTACTFICEHNPFQVSYEGREQYTYEFVENANYFTLSWLYLDQIPVTGPSFNSEFIYNPPALSLIGPADFIDRVEFHDNRMFWYYDFDTQTNKNFVEYNHLISVLKY